MTDRPILPAHAFLNQNGIQYKRRAFPTTTEKGAAAVAHALGYSEHHMVKTLIFETDRGEACLVMLGGNQSAVSSNLKKALGSQNIRLAAPEKVVRVTGYVVGSIPPFHWQPAGFFDRSSMPRCSGKRSWGSAPVSGGKKSSSPPWIWYGPVAAKWST